MVFYNDCENYNFFHFVYTSGADDTELAKHFCRVVYKNEYGTKFEEGITGTLDIYELRQAHDWTTGKNYKITLHL